MRALLILFLLIPLISFSQIYYDKNNPDEYYINYNTKELKLKFEDYEIQGFFSKLDIPFDADYLVVRGIDNMHMVMRVNGNSSFYGIDILKGEFKDVLKGFRKGRKYGKKVQLIYSTLPFVTDRWDKYDKNKGYELISERELEKVRKDKEFQQKIIDSGLDGIYTVRIGKRDGIDYSDDPRNKAKIIITSAGVTIESEIFGLIRGAYDSSYNTDPLEGQLACRILKGSGKFFIMSINKDSGVGAFTTQIARGYSITTTFRVLEKNL